MTSRDDEKIAVERQIPKTASGIDIPRHANAFESQPGGPGDDVHDHVPLSELADIVRSPGGARSASKGGATIRGRKLNRSPLYSRSSFDSDAGARSPRV